MKNGTTVFIDIETDRLEPTTANPIQIAMIAVDKVSLEEIEDFEVKIDFDVESASPEALDRNCYDDEVWEYEAIDPATAIGIADDFLLRHSDWKRVTRKGASHITCELAGHNVANYDAVVLKSWYDRRCLYAHFAWWTTGPVDTMHMARCLAWAKGEHWPAYNLEALCERFEISLENSHDALADVIATVELAKALKEEMRK